MHSILSIVYWQLAGKVYWNYILKNLELFVVILSIKILMQVKHSHQVSFILTAWLFTQGIHMALGKYLFESPESSISQSIFVFTSQFVVSASLPLHSQSALLFLHIPTYVVWISVGKYLNVEECSEPNHGYISDIASACLISGFMYSLSRLQTFTSVRFITQNI